MAATDAVLKKAQSHEKLIFNRFSLNDRKLIETYVDTFKPESCEYNFSNLFAWQDACQFSWTIYHKRLLIYEGLSQCAFMPLGKDFQPKELVNLSLNLKKNGLKPNFNLFTTNYLKKYPEIDSYYALKKERNDSEYIYDVDNLCDLAGRKLHKKRNLISQFKRLYPYFEIHPLNGLKAKALELAENLYQQNKKFSKTLDQEFHAIEVSFEYFDRIGLEGLALTVRNKLVAFSIFSRLSDSTYDIQFEKFNTKFKGAAQVINQETARYLKGKCQFLNREQDLGIKGLRQAKMSYLPEKLMTPNSLIFIQPNA